MLRKEDVRLILPHMIDPSIPFGISPQPIGLVLIGIIGCRRRVVATDVPAKDPPQHFAKRRGQEEPTSERVPKKKQTPPSKARPQKKVGKTKWLPLIEYLRREEKQTGSINFAITDLENELETGKRRSGRRDIRTGTREPVAASFWAGHLIDISTGAPTIYRCLKGDKDDPRRWGSYAHHHDDLVGGHVYFVLDRIDRRGASPKFTNKQEAALRSEYQNYKKARPALKEDANTHLQTFAKSNFGKSAHPDTIRDRIMTPVDKADDLEN